MQGHFEINNTAYPIGYLNVGDGYKVNDMRNLHTLHSHPIPKDQAVQYAASLNHQVRTNKVNINDEEALRSAVALLVG